MEQFASRETAGVQLASALSRLGLENPFLLAIPRGGVQVAEAVANRLNMPINVVVVKKLPLPTEPGGSLGAMTEDYLGCLNEDIMVAEGITQPELDKIYQATNREIKRRTALYGQLDEGRVGNSTVILIDDGAATGSTMIACLRKLKELGPIKLIAAVPVCSVAAQQRISRFCDLFFPIEVSDSPIFAVSDYYRQWDNLTDADVVEILERYRKKS